MIDSEARERIPAGDLPEFDDPGGGMAEPHPPQVTAEDLRSPPQ
jgi:hypothetical protein